MHVMMKKNQKQKMTQKRISEGLAFEDLKGLINDNVMIDLHKPKIGAVEDTVVVAFDVTYEDPAKDLSQFIETGALDHLDVEVSASPDADGTWKVFVEFMRDNDLFEKIAAMLTSVNQITSGGNDNTTPWTYRAFNVKEPVEFNAENFRRDVIDSRYEYRKAYLRDQPTKDVAPDQLEEQWHARLRNYKGL
jgi:hypothetical protein